MAVFSHVCPFVYVILSFMQPITYAAWLVKAVLDVGVCFCNVIKS